MFLEALQALLLVLREFGAWGLVGAMVLGGLFLSARGFIHWAAACNRRIAFLESEITELRLDRSYWRDEAKAERALTTHSIGVAENAV